MCKIYAAVNVLIGLDQNIENPNFEYNLKHTDVYPHVFFIWLFKETCQTFEIPQKSQDQVSGYLRTDKQVSSQP